MMKYLNQELNQGIKAKIVGSFLSKRRLYISNRECASKMEMRNDKEAKEIIQKYTKIFEDIPISRENINSRLEKYSKIIDIGKETKIVRSNHSI